jgi:hypothetical protein
MSSPNPVFVAGTATLAVTPGVPLPSSNVAQASISVVVTDSAGNTLPAVVLSGAETPVPWSYSATFASGPATAVATAPDTAGATIGSVGTYQFTVAAAPPAQTFTAPAGFGFVAAATSPAAAAVHAKASLKT